jgi:hypothetical protein
VRKATLKLEEAHTGIEQGRIMKDLKAKKETSMDYARGYRDAIVDTWEEVMKMATKGYTSHEMQIMVKSQAYAAKRKIEETIDELEKEAQKGQIIEAEPEAALEGVAEGDLIMELHLKPRLSYLVKESKPERCFSIFERELQAGKKGLCIARESPRELRERYELGKTQIVWLTMSEKIDSVSDEYDEYLEPTNLPLLFSYVLNFLEGQPDGVILLEGIEYMISHNKFNTILKFVQKVNEELHKREANLLMSLSPQALEPRNFSLLEREMGNVV